MNTYKILSVVVFFFTSTAFAAPILSVTGQCRKQVTPDRVAVMMSSRVTDKDPGSAQKKAGAQYENLRREVKKLNLKDQQLQTASYSVNPEWDYSNNKRTLRGYTALIGLRIETSETARASEILALAEKLGLQDVENPSTFLSPDLAQKEYEACLKVAVESARSKADKMASAAGKKVGELASLDETPETVQQPIPMAKMSMAEDSSGGAGNRIGYEIKSELMEVTVYAKYILR